MNRFQKKYLLLKMVKEFKKYDLETLYIVRDSLDEVIERKEKKNK